jgi:hypothetical protein
MLYKLAIIILQCTVTQYNVEISFCTRQLNWLTKMSTWRASGEQRQNEFFHFSKWTTHIFLKSLNIEVKLSFSKVGFFLQFLLVFYFVSIHFSNSVLFRLFFPFIFSILFCFVFSFLLDLHFHFVSIHLKSKRNFFKTLERISGQKNDFFSKNHIFWTRVATAIILVLFDAFFKFCFVSSFLSFHIFNSVLFRIFFPIGFAFSFCFDSPQIEKKFF